MNPNTIEVIVNQLHKRIDELVAERDMLQYEVDAIPDIKAERDFLAMANKDLSEAMNQYQQLQAAAKLALDALEWFVENDDTNIGMPGNEFWEDGLNQGIQTIAALRQAGVQ